MTSRSGFWKQQAARGILCILLALVLVGCANQQATLLYTTDTHGRLVSGKDSIGMDVIAAVRKHTPNALLVDAGDYLQGDPIVNLAQGGDAIRLMKMAGYYAATLGNHEFDFGQETLRTRIAEAAAEPNPLLLITANILNANGTPFTRQAAVTTINGLKIGFFGLTTEETATQTHPSNVAGLVFADIVQTADKMAKSLRGEGCDIVVALTHVGTEGVDGVTSTDIAARVNGIDVIIDGHSHAVVEETVNNTLVVSSGAHAKALGKLDITRTRSGLEKSNTLLHTTDVASLTPDAAVAATMAGIQQEQATALARTVGHTPVDLHADRQDIRTRETNFGNLCTDAVRHMTGADIAILNGGSIRRSITKGAISKGDIVAAIPFSDAVLTKHVTGAQLIEILEHGFKGLPAEHGGFPQVSGLKLTVNPAKPAGKRISAASLANGKPLDLRKTYTLAVSDFLAAGGDGYPLLATLPTVRQFMPPATALERYLNEMGPKAFNNIQGGRITIVGAKLSAMAEWRLYVLFSLSRAA